jgi:hypothetical protein
MKIKSVFRFKPLALLILTLSAGNAYSADLSTWTATADAGLITNNSGVTTLNTGDSTLRTFSVGSTTSTAAYSDADGNTGSFGAILSDNISIAANNTFSFSWDFQTTSGSPYNDFAEVLIGSQAYYLSSIIALDPATDSGLQTFSHAFTHAFNGNITIVISHEIYNKYNSSLSISNAAINPVASSVPEIEEWAMLLLGLPLLSLAINRKLKKFQA